MKDKADYMVCVPKSTPAHFSDDIFSICCECGIELRERPHNPKGPKRICIHCCFKNLGLPPLTAKEKPGATGLKGNDRKDH